MKQLKIKDELAILPLNILLPITFYSTVHMLLYSTSTVLYAPYTAFYQGLIPELWAITYEIKIHVRVELSA
jgi:hypothetical protein